MTGKELFDIALDLCGLRRIDGSISHDTRDLEQRAISLINIVIAENAELDCRIRRIEHGIHPINELTDRVDASDIVASTVLPYSLARLLMIGEDDDLASGFHKLSNDAKEHAVRFGKARILPIAGVYE